MTPGHKKGSRSTQTTASLQEPCASQLLDRMTFHLAEQALERLSPEDRQRLLERQLDKL